MELSVSGKFTQIHTKTHTHTHTYKNSKKKKPGSIYQEFLNFEINIHVAVIKKNRNKDEGKKLFISVSFRGINNVMKKDWKIKEGGEGKKKPKRITERKL